MIEELEGLRETVHYAPQAQMRLYLNREAESYPDHWHTPIEILWVLQGQYHAVCERRSFPLKTGDLLLICPGAVHRLAPDGAGERLILQADCGPLRSLQDVNIALALMSPAFQLTAETAGSLHREVCRLLEKIRAEYQARHPVCEAMMYAHLLEMLARISREGHFGQGDAPDRGLAANREKMLLACEYIRDNCLSAPSLEMVADYVGFSKFHFDRLFKQFVGMNYCKYLNQQRIARAEELLIDPNITITQVAMLCGFSSPAAFTRAFRGVKHCTPTDYRRLKTG